MKMKRVERTLLMTLVLASTAGCHNSSSSSSNDATKPVLAAFNAVADMPDVTFLREEEVWAALGYGVATGYRSVDADQYDLHFDSRLPGDDTTSCQGDLDKDGEKDSNECTRVVAKSVNLLTDHEYLVVLKGQYGALDAQLYDDTPHEFSTDSNNGTGDTDTQVQVFNWSSLGTVDVYIEPPGTNLSATQVKATLSPGQEFNGMVVRGTYVVTLTPVADPSDALYLSEDLTLTERTRVGFAILEATNESTSNVRVARFRDQGGDLLDRRAETFTRLAHVAPSTGNIDVYVQEDYTTPFFVNLALDQTSPYVAIDPSYLDPLELDITPAGNVGALLTRQQLGVVKGSRSTLFMVQTSSGALDVLQAIDSSRRIAPYALLRLVNTVPRNVDYYVIPHSNNVYTSSPTQTLTSGSIGSSQSFDPGEYDVVLMRAGTTTIMFGPQQIAMAGGGVYTLVGVPTADVTRGAILLLDDFRN
jgi:hypothetical protein